MVIEDIHLHGFLVCVVHVSLAFFYHPTSQLRRREERREEWRREERRRVERRVEKRGEKKREERRVEKRRGGEEVENVKQKHDE